MADGPFSLFDPLSVIRKNVYAAADKLGVTLERVEFSGGDDIDVALARIRAIRPGALW